jgi:exonuclease III
VPQRRCQLKPSAVSMVEHAGIPWAVGGLEEGVGIAPFARAALCLAAPCAPVVRRRAPMGRALLTARAPRRSSEWANTVVQQRLGGVTQVSGAPPRLAHPSLFLVHPELVKDPPQGHWAHCMHNGTDTLDLFFFGVPRGLHPAVFGAQCAAAGLPGLAAGRFKRLRDTVRLTLTDRSMVLLIGKFGIGRFSRRLRSTCGWRCVLGDTTCCRQCVHQDAMTLASVEDRLRTVLQRICPAPQQPVPALLPVRGGSAPGLRIGSWNVRKGIATASRQQPPKAHELLDALRSHALDVVAVQETGEGGRRIVRGDTYYKWYTDPRQAAEGQGLGFFVRQCGLAASVAVGLPQATCQHCLWMRVDGAGRTPHLYIANVYLPVQGAAGTTSATYRSALDALLQDTLQFATLGEVILLGDFNTRLGQGDGQFSRVGPHGDAAALQGETAERSALLRDFLDTADLYSLNDRSPCEQPAWTRVQQVENTTQCAVLDYVLVGPNLISSSWQGQKFSVIPHDLPGADHRLLRLHLDSWGTGRSQGRQQRVYRWRLDRLLAGGQETLEQRTQLRQAYEDGLMQHADQFQEYAQQCLSGELTRDAAASAVAHRWERLVTGTARSIIGRRMVIPGVSKPWWDQELRAAVRARRDAHALWVAALNTSHAAARWATYLRLRRHCKRLVVRKRRAHRQRSHSDLGRMLCQDPHNFWRALNGILGKRGGASAGRVPAARDSDGVVVTDDAGIARVFRQHYASLASPGPDDLPATAQRQQVEQRVQQEAAQQVAPPQVAPASDQLGQPFTVQEIVAAVASLKNGKAVHDGCIPNELIKYGGAGMATLLHTLFDVLLRCETVPDSYRTGTIINLHKSGDTADPGNYRGITLLSCVGKVFCRCISNRLAAAVALHEGQAGFRPQRSCIDHLYTLSETIRARVAQRQHTYVFYLDIRKAFDSTWHDGLWAKLLDKGVGGKLWRTMRNMYSKTQSRVLVNGVKTDYFPIRRGTAQGCTLSPLLFDVFVDGLLEAVEASGFGVVASTTNVGGLMFADDFAGVESSAHRLQQLIDVVRNYLLLWGLQANISKSAVVVYGPTGSAAANAPNPPSPDHTWRWGDATIPVKDNYKYLGVVLARSGRWTAHLNQVVERGKATLAKYSKYLSLRSISRHVRLVLYKQYVRPVLEYAREVWQPTDTQGTELERLQCKAARMILGCFGGTASAAVRAELGLETLEERRQRAQLRWYRCLRNMPATRLPHAVYVASRTMHVPTPAARKWIWANNVSAVWDRLRDHAGAAPAQLQDGLPTAGLHDSFEQLGSAAFRGDAGRLVATAADVAAQRAMQGCSTLQHLPLMQLHSRRIQPYLVHPYYQKRGSVLKMQCRMGTLEVNALLNARRQRGSAADAAACQLCGQEETVNHFILHCPAYAEHREQLEGQLAALFPTTEQFQQFQSAPDTEWVAALLSDRFWQNLGSLEQANRAVCTFLSTAWDDRCAYVAALQAAE